MRKPKTTAPEIRMANVGTQKLRTAVWRGSGSARPLLFFNGIGANLEIAQPLAESLGDRDIITFDMPGVGGSPVPTVPYRPWWVAHAAKTILKANGYDNAIDVMGVSWGGGAAQQFAFQYPGRTNRLVLVATSPGVIMVPGDMAALSKMAHPMRYTSQEYLIRHFETLYGDEQDGAHKFAEHMRPPQLQGYLFQLGAMAGWSSLPFLPFLRAKTLVLAGDRDRIVPLANGRLLNFMIRDSRLHIVKDGGHLFILSKSDVVLPALRSFLDEPGSEQPAAKRRMQAAE